MKHTFRRIRVALVAVFAVASLNVAAQAQAADLPLAGASPLAGIAFDDLPFLLPVEVNFRMAMLAVSSELGRSCGRMEAYGWHMNQSEQSRVNQIFNSAIEKLRAQGYVAAPENLKSTAKDITVFTADRSNRHLMFLWSANDLGLVLNICETSVPMAPTHRPTSIPPAVQVFPMPMDVLPAIQAENPKDVKGKKKKGAKTTANKMKSPVEEFSPVGKWVGSYTCGQGQTGGTLQIESLQGRDFDGVFKFYPTDKNPSVPRGSYAVYGQYDKESKRILINPGEWISRPKNFYNTIIVGSFNPVGKTFSAFFQGVEGCTSFEARKDDTKGSSFEKKKKAPAKKAVKKSKATKKTQPSASKDIAAPAASTQSAIVPMNDKKAGGIDLTPQTAAPKSVAPTPAASTIAAPVATPTTAPAVPSNAVPLVAKPASAPAPVAPAASAAAVPVATTTPVAVPFIPSQAMVPSAAPPSTTAK